MLSSERKDIILSILMEKKNITVSDMAARFNVSTETIRRDFDSMEKAGFLIKSYGGASLKANVSTTSSKKALRSIMVDCKRRLSKAAANFIRPNECIFLDHSTTVFEMCQFIEDIPLTVMTNSLSVINHFADNGNITLVTPGGTFNNNTYSFFGLDSIKFLQSHNLDRAFISSQTVDLKKGIGDSNEMIAELRRQVILNSTTNYLLADNTKLDRSAFVTSAHLTDFDCFITNLSLPQEWRSFFRESNIKYIECDTEL